MEKSGKRQRKNIYTGIRQCPWEKCAAKIRYLNENEGVFVEDYHEDPSTINLNLELGYDLSKVSDEMTTHENCMKYYENPFCDGQAATPRNGVENVGSRR